MLLHVPSVLNSEELNQLRQLMVRTGETEHSVAVEDGRCRSGKAHCIKSIGYVGTYLSH